jgi:hypothetical protein
MKKLILGISVLLFTMSCDSNDYPIDQNESTTAKLYLMKEEEAVKRKKTFILEASQPKMKQAFTNAYAQ